MPLEGFDNRSKVKGQWQKPDWQHALVLERKSRLDGRYSLRADYQAGRKIETRDGYLNAAAIVEPAQRMLIVHDIFADLHDDVSEIEVVVQRYRFAY